MIGVNLVIVIYNRKKYIFREFGGVMGLIWNNYFKDVSYLVYIIDMVN